MIKQSLFIVVMFVIFSDVKKRIHHTMKGSKFTYQKSHRLMALLLLSIQKLLNGLKKTNPELQCIC